MTTKELERCILVWQFADAPKRYRDMSSRGGDEGFVVLVPQGMDLDGRIVGSLVGDDFSKFFTDDGELYIGRR